MRRRVAVALGVLLIGGTMSGCATAAKRAGASRVEPAAAEAQTPLIIRGVGVDPKTIDLQQHGRVTIRYELTQPATVTIDLVDEEGQVVRQLRSAGPVLGTQAVHWDGSDAEGRLVPKGVYRYIIRAQDAQGTESVYDPSGETGGEELEPRNFTYDPATGIFTWVLPKAGYVRLMVRLEGFPHLRTLLDWEPLEAGEQQFTWDGYDSSGLIKVTDHPRLMTKLSAFALPVNTIIVRSAQPPKSINAALYYPSLVKGEGASLHARHPRAVCHEVRFRVEFPEQVRHDAKGRPLLVGVVPVRVILDERDAPHLINQRFEIGWFEDLTIVAEEEDGTSPFTFLWDTTHLPLGEHVLTVNILSYDDHYGVNTQAVIVGARP